MPRLRPNAPRAAWGRTVDILVSFNASIRDAIHDAVEPVRNKLDTEQAQATELVDDDPSHPAGPLSVRVRRG